jgi:hypothetical protein
MTVLLLANLVILAVNVAVLGLTVKLYTEFVKEKKYRVP